MMDRIRPSNRANNRPFYDLAGFARLFLRTRSIKHHKDIRTEDLAEAFRRHMCLPPFPTLDQLRQLCRDLEVELGELPKGSPLPGANTSLGSTDAIFVRPDLPTSFSETTLGHELREVIERAFKRIDSSYEGLDTSDNKAMHGESEFFALCLLMQAEATHQRLCETGFDVVRFADERRRSLPSVIMRVKTLYGSDGRWQGPAAGMWLFQGPRRKTDMKAITAHALKVRYQASLCGFSTDKSGSQVARRAHLFFPRPGTSGEDFAVVRRAVEQGKPVRDGVSLNDLFGEQTYEVIAEPVPTSSQTQRVMVTAARHDCLPLVEPLLRRLGLTEG